MPTLEGTSTALERGEQAAREIPQRPLNPQELQDAIVSLVQGMQTSLIAVTDNKAQGGRHMTPPIYQDGDDPELFLQKFENCAEANGWSFQGAALVNRVLNSMKKPADGWYKREILPHAPYLSWDQFKALFIEEYTQPLQVTLNQLRAKKQGANEGVRAFSQDLCRLCARLPNWKSDPCGEVPARAV